MDVHLASNILCIFLNKCKGKRELCIPNWSEKTNYFCNRFLIFPLQRFASLALAPSYMWLHRLGIRHFRLPKTPGGESVPYTYSVASSYSSLFCSCPPVSASSVPAILILAPMATSLCSSGNGSVSSSPPSTATFYNMEVAWFSLTTFFPLFIRPSVFVPKPLLLIYWFCMWIYFSKKNKWIQACFLSSPNILWTLLFYAWLSERGKNYYYFKHCRPTFPWQDQHELNWNHKHFKM